MLGNEIKVSNLKMGSIIYGVVQGERNGLRNIKPFMRGITYYRSLAASARVAHFGRFIIPLRNESYGCAYTESCNPLCLVIIESKGSFKLRYFIT